MPVVKTYRFHCRNINCGAEFLRSYPVEEFEYNQYHTANGWGCFRCGFPKMAVIKSNKIARDGFLPGWQPNIREYCRTYSEYKQKLKEKGLVEIGFDEVKDNEKGYPSYWDDETLKKVYDLGVDISGQEAEALKQRIKEEDVQK